MGSVSQVSRFFASASDIPLLLDSCGSFLLSCCWGIGFVYSGPFVRSCKDPMRENVKNPSLLENQVTQRQGPDAHVLRRACAVGVEAFVFQG